MGPGYPFISPFFEAVPLQLGFLSDPFKDFYFIFLFSSLCKSRNSCILSSTLTEFAIILKEGTFVGESKGHRMCLDVSFLTLESPPFL